MYDKIQHWDGEHLNWCGAWGPVLCSKKTCLRMKGNELKNSRRSIPGRGGKKCTRLGAVNTGASEHVMYHSLYSWEHVRVCCFIWPSRTCGIRPPWQCPHFTNDILHTQGRVCWGLMIPVLANTPWCFSGLQWSWSVRKSPSGWLNAMISPLFSSFLQQSR